MRRVRGWLSPGTVLAFIALVVALGGTGYAATGRAPSHDGNAAAKKKKHKSRTLTSSAVKKIADAEIQKLAPKLSVASAKSATTATSADSAKIATNVLSANVQADGTMLGSIPAGATSSKAALGDYRVTFNRPLAGCTISAAAANNTGPSLAFVAVGVVTTPANTLQVFTRAPTNTVADEPFYVQVICPA
jgi:hypothetical protein